MSVERLVDIPATLAQRFKNRVESLARDAIAARGAFSIAFPGGSAGDILLPALATADVDWTRVEVFFGDERAVPPEHPDSNFALAKAHLLDRIPIPDIRVHRMQGEAADLDTAARDYEAEIRRVLGPGAALDVVLLGVGPDGHVCSLFERHAALDEKERLAVAITDSPKPPPRRITLTLRAIAGARLIVIAAFGEGKAEVIHQAIEEPDSALPVALCARSGPDVLFLLDSPAAGRIGVFRP